MCDGIAHTTVFAALGVSVRGQALGGWAFLLGALAGAAVAYNFWLRVKIEEMLGETDAELPDARLFEVEDMLYLFPLIALLDVRLSFTIASVIGAPCFALWMTWYFSRQKRRRRAAAAEPREDRP